jgi:pilus assembly protein Flp/PilA
MLREIKSLAVRIWKDEQGASLLEYSVLIGLIVAGVVASITAVGLWTGGRWDALKTVLGIPPT